MKKPVILGMSYEDYTNMKYRMLKKALEEQEELEDYQHQLDMANDYADKEY